MLAILLGVLLATQGVAAHLSAFDKGMYCLNGPQLKEEQNSNALTIPLYQLNFDEWWMHHVDKCDEYPPAKGDFLNLPAGGSFTVELATNRGKTSLSFDGNYTSEWPDGERYGPLGPIREDGGCIGQPNFHTENETMAAGTAFAISYHADIKAVTPENLVVFTTLDHTPWRRIATYQVPDLPACPPGGCTCAWGWVPNGCGQPNMYMQPFRCKVTGATSTTPLATAQPPRWCEDDESKCVTGAKQLIYWQQKTGNNIEVLGFDKSGRNKSPAYNMKCGFANGAQNDIFAGPPSEPPVSPSPVPTGQDPPPESSGTPTSSDTLPTSSDTLPTSDTPPTPTTPTSSDTLPTSSDTLPTSSDTLPTSDTPPTPTTPPTPSDILPSSTLTNTDTYPTDKCLTSRSMEEEEENLIRDIAERVASHLERRHTRRHARQLY